jgi:putative phosphoribosyl transferase
VNHLHTLSNLRNRHQVFQDRSDAGRMLGEMLAPDFAGNSDVIVLSIPMGGIPVGMPVAEKLACAFDLLIVRKIQIPGNTEAGMGAMTQEGDVFVNEALMASLELDSEDVRRQAEKVEAELRQRNRKLRGCRPLPDMEGKDIILVDDGLASGFTIKAAVYMVRKRNAGRIIVAVPTGPLHTLQELAANVEELYCLNIRDSRWFAVADAYVNWRDLSEAEVLSLLEKYEKNPESDKIDNVFIDHA